MTRTSTAAITATAEAAATTAPVMSSHTSSTIDRCMASSRKRLTASPLELGQPADGRARVGHQRAQHVDAGQRVPEHPAAVPLHDGEAEHGPAADLDDGEDDEQPGHRFGRAGGDAVEDRLQEQPGGDRQDVPRHPADASAMA